MPGEYPASVRGLVLTTLLIGSMCFAAEPEGKVVEPFNGKNLQGWKLKGPEDQSHWRVGLAQVNPNHPELLVFAQADTDHPAELVNTKAQGVDISTEQKFGDVVIELEFMVPKGSNSGVYVMGEYEVQIFDSYGKQQLGQGDVGAIYSAAAPRTNAARAPGQWQTLVIDFQAPRYSGEEKVENALFRRVVLNGETIHENVQVPGPTPGGLTGKEAPKGPLMFQGDHGAVAYRKIRIHTAEKP